MVPLPSGQWLALTAEAFQEGLGAGGQIVPPNGTQGGVATDVEPLLTSEQLESRTGVPASWYEQAVREERVPHHRIGRYVRFRLSEIADHFAERPPGYGSPIASHRLFRTKA